MTYSSFALRAYLRAAVGKRGSMIGKELRLLLY